MSPPKKNVPPKGTKGAKGAKGTKKQPHSLTRLNYSKKPTVVQAQVSKKAKSAAIKEKEAQDKTQSPSVVAKAAPSSNWKNLIKVGALLPETIGLAHQRTTDRRQGLTKLSFQLLFCRRLSLLPVKLYPSPSSPQNGRTQSSRMKMTMKKTERMLLTQSPPKWISLRERSTTRHSSGLMTFQRTTSRRHTERQERSWIMTPPIQESTSEFTSIIFFD